MMLTAPQIRANMCIVGRYPGKGGSEIAHHVVQLYDYHVWANTAFFNRLKELPREIYDKEITSVFPSICKTLSHIYVAESFWCDILSGKSMNEALAGTGHSTEQTETLPIAEMETMFFALSERYRALVSQQAEPERLMVIDHPLAGLRETSFADLVVHVVNHGTYHRGNITAMLRQMGHASVATDYWLFASTAR